MMFDFDSWYVFKSWWLLIQWFWLFCLSWHFTVYWGLSFEGIEPLNHGERLEWPWHELMSVVLTVNTLPHIVLYCNSIWTSYNNTVKLTVLQLTDNTLYHIVLYSNSNWTSYNNTVWHNVLPMVPVSGLQYQPLMNTVDTLRQSVLL